MGDDNYDAACELALELPFFDAMKFLRGEIGVSLLEARGHAIRLANLNHESVLGKSFRAETFAVLAPPNPRACARPFRRV